MDLSLTVATKKLGRSNGPEKAPEEMTDHELLDALNLRNQLLVGDIRDCKQFIGGDSSKNESWAPLSKDQARICVPPPSGYVIDKP